MEKDFDLLDGYDSIHTIEGGMSLIKVCNSKIDNEIVVVKIPKELSLQDNGLRVLWLFESRNWLDVGYHQNILGFRRLHFAGGIPHLVFDFVENNLRKSINTIDLKDILTISIGLCEALTHLQSKLKAFIHNDLKPENILLDKNKIPKLADLGVSYSAKNKELLKNDYKLYYHTNLKYSTTLNYGGTEAYKSPEQKSRGEISILSDIYAFGLILYEMLTGVTYYFNSNQLDFNYVDKRFKITKNQFQNLQSIIQNCVKTNPEDRIQNFEEIAAKLKKIYFETYNTIITDPKKMPHNEGRIFGFIDSLIKFGEFTDANNLLNELTDESQIYFLKSKIANKQKDFKKAIEFANLGIQKITFQNNLLIKIPLLEQLANGYSGDNQYNLSIEIRLEIAKLAPELGANYNNIGNEYLLSGNLLKAEHYLRKSISCTTDIGTYDLLFKTLYQLEKYDEIIALLIELEDNYKQNPIYFRLRAESLLMIASKVILKNNTINFSFFEESKKWFLKLKAIEQLLEDDNKKLAVIDEVLKMKKNNS